MKRMYLWLAMLVLFGGGESACGGGDDDTAAAGEEGGPCFPNDTCNSGLSCYSDLCVNDKEPSPKSTAGTGGRAADDSNPPIHDSKPISAANAAGLWKLHYDWKGTPPDIWTLLIGTASTGDLRVGMLSDIKHGGMLEAQTGWQGFVPLIDSSEDGSGSIEWSLSGQTSSGSFMLDFTGDGTGDALTGMIKVSDDDRVGSWSASKVTTQFVSLEDLAGDWTEDFQWMGRGPGVLLRTCDAKGTCKIAAGQNGGPTSEEVGTVSLTGNRFDTTWPTERTQVGVFVSKDLAWGYMDTLDGKTPGTWTLSRGNQIDDSTSTPGCTSNSDCVGCERCELSTGRCVVCPIGVAGVCSC